MTGGARKRVLILISSLSGGGAERVACKLASALSERHDVFLMPFSTSERRYPVDERVHLVDSAKYDLRDKKSRPLQLLRLAHTALHVLPMVVSLRKREHVDATISMLLAPNIINVIAPGGGRRVLCERNNPARKGAIRMMLGRWAYARADHVVFQSAYVRDLFSRRVCARSHIIPNPVSVHVAAVAPARREHLVVSAGRLVPQKNHDLLIRAFAAFREDHPDYELHIYGDGPRRDALQALVGELGLGGCVHLEPFCDDLHERISSARVFVLSSDFEGMPNALLEAMAMGHACVCTAYPAADELVTDGVDALLVPTGDVAALAGAMARVADDDELLGRLSGAALERSRDFSPDVIIPQWEALL